MKTVCDKPMYANETRGRTVIGKYDVTPCLIRDARRAAGLTQQKLAAVVGVKPETVSTWERGIAYPSKGAALVEQILGIRLPGPRCVKQAGHKMPCRP